MKWMYKLVIAALVLTLVAGIQAAAQGRVEKVQAERIINGPRIGQVTDTGATIAWTTNTGGGSVIKYGTNPSHLDQTAESPMPTRKTPHTRHTASS
jgi:hypothetical protein